ncbi:MAG: LysE family transporter [Cloacibacillus evryensis]
MIFSIEHTSGLLTIYRTICIVYPTKDSITSERIHYIIQKISEAVIVMNFAAFFSYVILTAITPGPNNIMSMSNASRYGFRRSLPFNFGVFAGFLVVMSLSALFSSLLYDVIPSVKPLMLYVGAAYILWLAWTVWRDAPHEKGGRAAYEYFSLGDGAAVRQRKGDPVLYNDDVFVHPAALTRAAGQRRFHNNPRLRRLRLHTLLGALRRALRTPLQKIQQAGERRHGAAAGILRRFDADRYLKIKQKGLSIRYKSKTKISCASAAGCFCFLMTFTRRSTAVSIFL